MDQTIIDMDWSNLKEHRCPKCGSPLKSEGMLSDKYLCIHCDFQIGSTKYDKIVATSRDRAVKNYNPDDNLSALNNL
jgi:DNA-directed RNA polymerase subunit RPC12/RpoP